MDLYHLFWIFVVVSLVGLIVETVVSLPVDGYWKDRAGLVWGPFSPIYGLGAVIFSACLHRLHDRPLPLFLAAAAIGASFEWFAGRTFENVFGFVAWSYIDQPFCIDGYTSLGMALIWGAGGFVWVRWGLPAVWTVVDAATERAPELAKVVTVVVAVFMAVNVAATLYAFECWFDRHSGNPVDTPVQRLFDEQFPDEFMDARFQTISMYPVLATRG